MPEKWLSQAEVDAPDDDELEAIRGYQNGDPDYQPAISHEELLAKLGLK